jgi:hypothetical protein
MVSKNTNGEFRGSVQEAIANLKEDIKDIRENHLSHIQDRLDKLTLAVIVAALGLIANLVVALSSR